MDTPTIAKYYREHDPLKRKKLLEQSIADGECPEENAIRRELWDVRYAKDSQTGNGERADGYLALWMTLEFNKDAGSKLFGFKRAKKEIEKHLAELKFQEYLEKGGLYTELFYREVCHMIKMYMELCETDKSYNNLLFGLVHMNEDNTRGKIQADIKTVAVDLPSTLHMEQELGILTRAAREMYSLHFPDEPGI